MKTVLYIYTKGDLYNNADFWRAHLAVEISKILYFLYRFSVFLDGMLIYPPLKKWEKSPKTGKWPQSKINPTLQVYKCGIRKRNKGSA